MCLIRRLDILERFHDHISSSLRYLRSITTNSISLSQPIEPWTIHKLFRFRKSLFYPLYSWSDIFTWHSAIWFSHLRIHFLWIIVFCNFYVVNHCIGKVLSIYRCKFKLSLRGGTGRKKVECDFGQISYIKYMENSWKWLILA